MWVCADRQWIAWLIRFIFVVYAYFNVLWVGVTTSSSTTSADDYFSKTAGGIQFDSPCGFSNSVSSQERVKPWFLWLLILS